MSIRLSATLPVARRTLRVARAADVTFLAAGVAYYAFVSVLPAMVLALAVAAALGGPALERAVLGLSGEFLTESGRALVVDALDGTGRAEASAVGAAVLLWGTLKVFRGLDTAFSRVYGVRAPSSLREQLVDSAVVLASIGLSFGVMLAVGGVLAATDLPGALDLLGIGALPLVLTVAFLPVYYRFPDRHVSVRETLPGAVLAALGWTALQAGFQAYAAGAGRYELYGLVGGVILLVTWFYLAGVVLLAGAALNVVLGGLDVADGRDEPAAGAPLRPDAGPTPDRQLQHPEGRRDPHADMAERDGEDGDRTGAPDIADLDERVRALRADLEEFEADLEDRTVSRSELEADLRAYVRKRARRGKARGWGPYLVLLYGTVMTVAAFYLLSDLLAVVAMVVIFLSTLGLYALFVLAGIGIELLDVPGRAIEFVRERRR